MDFSVFDQRPIIVALAGPNGAGKTTFFRAHLSATRLRFVNADILSRDLDLDPYAAADLAAGIRRELVRLRESFVFETVLSDPVGDKIDFLESAWRAGYATVLCFIGLDSAEMSIERVAMRVSQGGHDVPDDKLRHRFGRILSNLARAIERLPHLLIFDNSNLTMPFRQVAVFEGQALIELHEPVPGWFQPLIVGR